MPREQRVVGFSPTQGRSFFEKRSLLGVRKKVEWKERKISYNSGTETHNLLLPGQVHQHCGMGELQMVGN